MSFGLSFVAASPILEIDPPQKPGPNFRAAVPEHGWAASPSAAQARVAHACYERGVFEVDPEIMRLMPVWFTATLLSMTAHEAAHAWVGGLGGDTTAEDQVTLDPTPHVRREPIGMILVPLVSYFLAGGGWMIGFASAPYDPYWAKNWPKKAALMALAGPCANFVLALLAVGVMVLCNQMGWWIPQGSGLSEIVVDASGEATAFTSFASILFSVNVLLGLFNLLPFAPLDGHAVVPLFLNERLTRKWLGLFEEPGAKYVGFAMAWVLFAKLGWPVLVFATQTLFLLLQK